MARGGPRPGWPRVLPPRTDRGAGVGPGRPGPRGLPSRWHRTRSAPCSNRVRGYRRARFDAGYGALTLPAEYGGAGLPSVYPVAFAEEEQAFEVPPSTEIISVTTGLVGSAVAVFGTPEQRERFARAFLRTDLLCCQLFSEPGAGSDLAGLSHPRRTRRRRVGRRRAEGLDVAGATIADYGLLLARTDPDVVKQAGITAFLVPMDAAGRRACGRSAR